jgi:hypothetical protein
MNALYRADNCARLSTLKEWTMKLFEIALPDVSNSGMSYDIARKCFEDDALEYAEGFTALPAARGVWRAKPSLGDPSPKTYRDVMHCYRIACDAGTFAILINRAFYLFPDQLAIFHAEIGEATISERP